MPVTSAVLRKYLPGSRVFVETGTHKGHGIKAALDAGYEEIYSCELNQPWYEGCRAEFMGDPRVEVYHLDSIDFLRQLVFGLPRISVFWLDAHPDHDSPVLRELEVLRRQSMVSHTILIDDRRLMQGHWRSVTEEQVLDAIWAIDPRYDITYDDGAEKDDIIVARVP